MKKIGIVGAGLMGSGIAQVAAQTGFEVFLNDLKKEFVEKGLEVIGKNLSRDVAKGRKTEVEKKILLDRIVISTNLEDLATVDLVIEAIYENMEAKKALFGKLNTICSPATILASNTSGLSITEIASVTNRPDKVIGMHFFNPVPVMKLVEIIKGNETSEETFQQALEVSYKFGKEPITVTEAPLFVVNRILVPMINEAAFVLQEGIASAEDIDKGMVLGANHPIGPLALADLIGLDTLLMVIDNLYQETADSKYRPCPLIKKLVRAGHLGKKTGRGFYQYKE
ncbi:MAG: 3-hydroxybutyryl-CoA dehydrogenase [Dethiobacteria bacterium]